MRPRTLTPPHPPATKINVTPLIDVVMVLIVFYLIVGKLASERQAPVDLPTAGSGAREEQSPALVITVAFAPSGASYLIDGQTIDPANLATALKTALPAGPEAGPVHIRADRRLAYALVEPVVKACRDAGLTSVKLVALRGDTP